MKIVIDISENIYNTIMKDIMPDEGQISAIVTRIYQGMPYEERPQGEWIEDNGILACSNCQTIWINRKPTDYCPNCGADMRGNNNE